MFRNGFQYYCRLINGLFWNSRIDTDEIFQKEIICRGWKWILPDRGQIDAGDDGILRLWTHRFGFFVTPPATSVQSIRFQRNKWHCAVPTKESHREIIGNIIGRILFFVGHLFGNFMERIWSKAPWYHSASLWISICWICLWENPQTLHFHDFGIFGRVTELQNQYHLFLEAKGYLRQLFVWKSQKCK